MFSFLDKSNFLFKDLLDDIVRDVKKSEISDFMSLSRYYLGDLTFGKILPKAKSSRFIEITVYFEESKIFFDESNISMVDGSDIVIDIYIMKPKKFCDEESIKRSVISNVSYQLMYFSANNNIAKYSSRSSLKNIDVEVMALAFSIITESFYFKTPVDYLIFKKTEYLSKSKNIEYNDVRNNIKENIISILESLCTRKVT
jgi:hypothetical protein